MLRTRLVRRSAAIGSAAVLGLSLATLPSSATAEPAPSPRVGGKDFAFYDYNWSPVRYVDHFRGGLSRQWKRTGHGKAYTKNGMLTLENANRGTMAVTLRADRAKVGRWSVRLRARAYERGQAPARAVVEVVPAKTSARHCGARDIALANYVPKRKSVRFYARHGKSQWAAKKRVGLRNDQWHTYAVQVTRKHITWFVDSDPIRRTTRAAYSDTPLTMRVALEGSKRRATNHSRLQIDTARTFSMEKRGGVNVKAPRPKKVGYAKAC
ncbi:family 16 glycosylhydrolase [Nocardioides insulae]|uniref:family 16 glycosylhydrolase n=1 Tax=Nocardioides insulae TaxID=394734 RepID=UPI0004257B8F|nr:family 16 glycosylhydrolase [Nocardioides insulae]